MTSSHREAQRRLLEGMRWLRGACASKVAGKSGVSQARSRLGIEPIMRLRDELAAPHRHSREAPGASKGGGTSLDGGARDVADDPSNEKAFGRPGASHGQSAYPQIRFVSLVENGAHVAFGTKMAGCSTREIALTRDVLPSLREGMLCLAGRNFFGLQMWRRARETFLPTVRIVRRKLIAFGAIPLSTQTTVA